MNTKSTSIPLTPITPSKMGARIQSGAPKWMVAGALAAAAAVTEPSTAHADEGSVVLRSGGRASGTIMLVLPNDRVVIRLADGTSMTFPWADVQLVNDGPRVYDSAGNVSVVASSAPVITPAAAANAGMVAPTPGVATGPTDMQSMQLEYQMLPRRGGTVALGVFGGLFLANGAVNLIGAGVVGCGPGFDYYYSSGSEDCTGRNIMIGTGIVSGGIGALMTAFAVRRSHARARGVESLRARGYMVAENGEGPALRLSVDFSPGGVAGASRLVPSLTLRF